MNKKLLSMVFTLFALVLSFAAQADFAPGFKLALAQTAVFMGEPATLIVPVVASVRVDHSAHDCSLHTANLSIDDGGPVYVSRPQPVGGQPGGNIFTAHAAPAETDRLCVNCQTPETIFPITEVGWQVLH